MKRENNLITYKENEMSTRVNLRLKSDDWQLLHSISQDNGLSLNKTCKILVELGLLAYTLNKDLIDYI